MWVGIVCLMGIHLQSRAQDTPPQPATIADVRKQLDAAQTELNALQAIRTWSSVDGKFTTQAKMTSLAEGTVALTKTDGKQASVSLDKLSQADREFATNWTTQVAELQQAIQASEQQLAELQAKIDPYDKPFFGWTYREVSSTTDFLKINNATPPTKQGLMIIDVIPNSPAAKAGFETLDIVVSINRKPVRTFEEMEKVVSALSVGDVCSISGYGSRQNNKGIFWQKKDTKLTVLSRREVLMNSLKIEKDSIKGTTVWQPYEAPDAVNERSWLGLYLIQGKDSIPTLRMRLHYVADDWLFIESIDVQTESVTLSKKFSFGKLETHVFNGGICEWVDLLVGENEREIFEAIADANDVTLRMNGQQFYKDRKLAEEEIEAIRRVLDVEKLLNRK